MTFLSKLEKLGAEATPAGWLANGPDALYDGPWIGLDVNGDGFQRFVCDTGNHDLSEADARFIATSRNCWDALVAVAKAAESTHDHVKFIPGDPDAFYMEDAELRDALAALRAAVEGEGT